jgi:hypothetical protein
MGYNSKCAANAPALVTKAAIALECRVVAMQTLLITFINLPNADQIYFGHRRLQWPSTSSTCHQFQLRPLQVDAGTAGALFSRVRRRRTLPTLQIPPRLF